MPEFDGVFEDGDEVESFEVELQADVQYIIDIVGVSSPFGRVPDPILQIFEGSSLIIEDDDSGPGLYPQALLEPTSTDSYTFEVRSLDGAPAGFTLRVFEDDFRYHPEGMAPAGVLGSAGASRGRINYRGDTDIHEVDLIEGLRYEIRALGSDSGSGSLADPELRLRAFSGRTIAADNSDAGLGANDFLAFRAETSGTHYIDVRGFDTETGSYRITVSEGRGTRSADEIEGTRSADAVNALGGADSVSGAQGDDVLNGGKGADELVGGLGDDVLVGGRGADALTGSGGADVFAFEGATDSNAGNRDVILSGPNGVALGKPGPTAGDIIDLTSIDANVERGGDQAFRFGASKAIGRVWLVEEGQRTIVRANVDEDARAEFELAISDHSVRASEYTLDDFAL